MRWGIVGTGAIAAQFAVAARVAGADVTAVASRSPDTGAAFARRFAIPAHVPDAAALAARDDVDVVYVATPNAAHLDGALAVIAAGTPVLCEKPLAPSTADARRIVDAARAADVFCMEGLWSLCLPAYRAAFEALTQGKIGEVRAVRGSFCVPHSANAMPRLHGGPGGGALLDRGVYLLALAQAVLGDLHLTHAAGDVAANGTDLSADLMLTSATGARATLSCAIDRMGANRLEIEGTHGRLLFSEPVTNPTGFQIRRADPETAFTGPTGFPDARARAKAALRRQPQVRALAATRGTRTFPGGLEHQILEVEACLAASKRESALVPLDGSLRVLETIDAARTHLAKST